ncbi:hypothetical protein BDW69DRAFT_68479 [Aspergillus filifer]
MGMVYPWSLFLGCSILRRTICILILGFRPLGDTRNKTKLLSVPFHCEHLKFSSAVRARCHHTFATE